MKGNRKAAELQRIDRIEAYRIDESNNKTRQDTRKYIRGGGKVDVERRN